ncbi:MAG: hypothetical protein H8D67_23575 [Deltaproteobacteria bacterium]|nr:hypothetical protein [Deltaproteobacteria bacterium]
MEASKKGERFAFSLGWDSISAYLPQSAKINEKTHPQAEYKLTVRDDDLFVLVGEERISMHKWFGHDTE